MQDTFLGFPYGKINDITKGTITLIGSTVVSRTEHDPLGQEFSADWIRKCSYEYTGFIDYQEKCIVDYNVIDLGNFNKEELGDIVKAVIENGGVPIVFGGDHTTTYYALEKLQPNKLTVLDAHFDFADQNVNPDAEPISHGFINKLLVAKGWEITIYGTRAYSSFCNEYEDAKKAGVKIIPWFGNENMMNSVIENSIYLSIDMDFFDLSSFPATRVPEVGGATLREFISTLRSTKNFSPKYIDLVEYAPEADFNKAYCKAMSILIMEIIAKLQNTNQTN